MRHAGLKLALPTAAALGAGAAIAIGAIPGDDGTITGCYVTNTDVVPGGAARYGELRLIDPSQPATLLNGGPNEQAVCLNGEATVTWNQRGPQGPPGAPGAQGSAGPAGPVGLAGRDLIGSTTFGFDGAGGTFLKLDGIAGEATQKDHKDWIELSSFSLGGGGAASSGGGGGAGKATISSFTITKKLDKSSPALFQAAGTGKHIKFADIAFAKKTRGKVRDYLVFKFDTVFVSSIQQGSGGGGAAKEQVTFSFQKATESFLGANGKPTQSVTIDVGVNKKA